VKANEPVTITVTDRNRGTPVPAASVYALTWPELNASDAADLAPSRTYNSEFLGRTNSDGEVVHAFDRIGRVLIVATKEGWGPGLARLAVKPDLRGRLAIRAPRRAAVNEPVTIGVVEKRSGEAVPGADAWAINLPELISTQEIIPSTGDLKALFDEIKGEGSGNITELLNSRGEYLGRTNNEGELEHTFTDVGRYLLVTTKSGYAPGFKAIAIVTDKALAIKAEPRRVDVGEDVTFTAMTRGTSTPVAGVDLYALGIPFLNPLQMSLREMKADGVSLEQMAIDNGMYIGTTNENGQATYQFQEEGIYLIVGIKDGYVPGVTFVAVGQFSGLRQMFPFPQLKRFEGEFGPKGELPRVGPFGEHSGLNKLFPQLKRFGERTHERPWQQDS